SRRILVGWIGWLRRRFIRPRFALGSDGLEGLDPFYVLVDSPQIGSTFQVRRQRRVLRRVQSLQWIRPCKALTLRKGGFLSQNDLQSFPAPIGPLRVQRAPYR